MADLAGKVCRQPDAVAVQLVAHCGRVQGTLVPHDGPRRVEEAVAPQDEVEKRGQVLAGARTRPASECRVESADLPQCRGPEGHVRPRAEYRRGIRVKRVGRGVFPQVEDAPLEALRVPAPLLE